MGHALENPFMFGARFDPGTQSRVNMVGAKCKKCGKEQWRPAPGPGWGRRLLKQDHWVLGNGPNSHKCPDCAAGKRPNSPNGRTINTVVADTLEVPAPLKVAEPGARVPAPSPVEHAPVNPVMAEKLAPAKEAVVQAQEQAKRDARSQVYGALGTANSAECAARRAIKLAAGRSAQRGRDFEAVPRDDGRWGYVLKGELATLRIPDTPEDAAERKRLGVERAKAGKAARAARGIKQRSAPPGLFATRSGVYQAVRRALRRPDIEDGLDYWSMKRSDGYWYWLRPADVDVADPAFRQDRLRSLNARVSRPGVPVFASHLRVAGLAKLVCAWLGIPDAKEGRDFRVKRTSDDPIKHAYTLIEPRPVVVEHKAPPAPDPLLEARAESYNTIIAQRESEPPMTERQPTPEDRRRIRQRVEDVYNEDKQRYRDDWSDQKLAESMDVPRAWVSNVRELYGPDANESVEKDVAAIRAGLAQVDEALAVVEEVMKYGAVLERHKSELTSRLARFKL